MNLTSRNASFHLLHHLKAADVVVAHHVHLETVVAGVHVARITKAAHPNIHRRKEKDIIHLREGVIGLHVLHLAPGDVTDYLVHIPRNDDIDIAHPAPTADDVIRHAALAQEEEGAARHLIQARRQMTEAIVGHIGRREATAPASAVTGLLEEKTVVFADQLQTL